MRSWERIEPKNGNHAICATITRSRRGSTARKDGAVVKKHFGAEVFRIAFYGAWVKSASFTDLEAGSTNPLKQTVVLEHDGLELILPG